MKIAAFLLSMVMLPFLTAWMTFKILDFNDRKHRQRVMAEEHRLLMRRFD